jgi:hypothetical protein
MALQEKYTTYRPNNSCLPHCKIDCWCTLRISWKLFYIGPQIVYVCMYVCMLWNVWGVCIGKLQEYTQFGSVKGFFCWWSFVKKKKNKMNTFKMKWFWRVSIAKSEKENSQISLFGFQLVAVNIECRLKIYTSYLVYSQVWLNLPMNDHHFLNILRWLQVRLHFFLKIKFSVKLGMNLDMSGKG